MTGRREAQHRVHILTAGSAPPLAAYEAEESRAPGLLSLVSDLASSTAASLLGRARSYVPNPAAAAGRSLLGGLRRQRSGSGSAASSASSSMADLPAAGVGATGQQQGRRRADKIPGEPATLAASVWDEKRCITQMAPSPWCVCTCCSRRCCCCCSAQQYLSWALPRCLRDLPLRTCRDAPPLPCAAPPFAPLQRLLGGLLRQPGPRAAGGYGKHPGAAHAEGIQGCPSGLAGLPRGRQRQRRRRRRGQRLGDAAPGRRQQLQPGGQQQPWRQPQRAQLCRRPGCDAFPAGVGWVGRRGRSGRAA